METNVKQSILIRKKIAEFKDKLTKLIDDCNQVYLTTHKNADYDAIASLGAMGLICKKLKKAPYIIIDQEDYNSLPQDRTEMFEKINEKFVIRNLDEYNYNKTEKSLLIVVDVNKTFMTPLRNNYRDFSNVIIIDHHEENEDTIKTKNKLIMSDMVSSCSEILYWLLKQYKVTPSDIDYYTFLLAGIRLDTNQGSKNMYPSTHECISDLINKGANKLKVDLLFAPDYESDRKVQRLVDKIDWKTIRYAIAIGNDETYTKEEVAQAADYALRYVCEAAIFLGKNDQGGYNVSARSNRGNIHIDNIMYLLNNGGGNMSNASCPTIFTDAQDQELEKEELTNKINDIIYFKSYRKKTKKRYYLKNKKLFNHKKEENL